MARKKLKVVMLGEGRVGKTSLLHRFVHNNFDEECPSTTKATMYANTKVEVGETTADVSVWDTAGQERYHALGPIYYRDAHGAVLAYDITDKDSFDKVKVWLKELHQVVGENINVVVVGNKCDLERERKVGKKEAEEWAAAHGAQHFLCSAKLGIRVADAFTALVTAIVKSLGTASGVQAGTGNSTSSGAYNGGRPAPANQRSKGVKIAPDETAREAPPEKKECGC
jgi:Rab family, other